MHIAILLFLVFTVCNQEFVDSQKISTSNLSSARGQAYSLSIQEYVVFAGGVFGINPLIYSDVMDIFNTATRQWETPSTLPKKAVFTAGAVAGDEIFLFSSPSIITFDIMTKTSNISASSHTTGAAMTALDNFVFIAGGGQLTSPDSLVSILDVRDHSWTYGNLSQARTNIVAVSVGDIVMFAGGQIYPNLSSVIDIYNVTSKQWSVTNFSTPRVGMTTGSTNNKAFFFGGVYNSAFILSVTSFDITTGTWSTISGLNNVDRGTWNGKASFDSLVFTTYSSTFGQFNTSNNKVISRTLSAPRSLFSFQASNNYVLVAGGRLANNTYVSTVDIYHYCIIDADCSDPCFVQTCKNFTCTNASPLTCTSTSLSSSSSVSPSSSISTTTMSSSSPSSSSSINSDSTISSTKSSSSSTSSSSTSEHPSTASSISSTISSSESSTSVSYGSSTTTLDSSSSSQTSYSSSESSKSSESHTSSSASSDESTISDDSLNTLSSGSTVFCQIMTSVCALILAHL